MKTQSLINLIYAPNVTSELLHYFLSGAQSVQEQGIKIELIYLLLPFIYDTTIREKLIKTNKNGTINTVFPRNLALPIKNSLLEQTKNIPFFRKTTNNALIYLSTYQDFELKKYIKISTTLKAPTPQDTNFSYKKAAYNLGLIFAKQNYIAIFLRFGITV